MATEFNIKEEANGKWLDILRSLGIDIREDGSHGPCPIIGCGGRDRFRFDNKNGNGTYFCSQCSKQSGDGFDLIMGVMGVDFKQAAAYVKSVLGVCDKKTVPKESKMTSAIMRKIFNGASRIVSSDPAGQYLMNRGLSTIPLDLYYMEQCWEPETKKNQHALLALVRLPDGRATTMHRTFLTKSGNKLDIVKKPKKILPTLYGTEGAAIRLVECDKKLGVCEGIETGIAAFEDTRIPTWPCISNIIMESFIPPPSVEELTIFVDNDANYVGQKSAYTLANKMVMKYKLKVDVRVPETKGDDWLDRYIKNKTGNHEKHKV